MATVKEWIDKGSKYFDKGKFNEAINVYKKALNLEPKNVDVLIKIGLSYRHLEEYEIAIDYYDKVLEIEPDNKTALNNIGYVMEVRGEIEDAIEMYKKSLEIDPNYDIPLVNLTNIYFDRKEYTNAITVFKDALKIDPLNTANWIDLGRAYRFLEKYEKAIMAYSKALKLENNSKIAWNNLGWVYFCTNENEKAIEAYTRSLEIDWLYDLPFSNLIKIYKKMIEEDSKDSIMWKNIANGFYVAKAYKRAIDACNRSLEINESNDVIKLHKKIIKEKIKFDKNPALLNKIEDALDLFSTISTSALLRDVIDYIKYKSPELSLEFNDKEIKFKIFETIRDKEYYAKLDKKKLLFYEKPPSSAKVDYMK